MWINKKTKILFNSTIIEESSAYKREKMNHQSIYDDWKYKASDCSLQRWTH